MSGQPGTGIAVSAVAIAAFAAAGADSFAAGKTPFSYMSIQDESDGGEPGEQEGRCGDEGSCGGDMAEGSCGYDPEDEGAEDEPPRIGEDPYASDPCHLFPELPVCTKPE